MDDIKIPPSGDMGFDPHIAWIYDDETGELIARLYFDDEVSDGEPVVVSWDKSGIISITPPITIPSGGNGDTPDV